MTHWRDGAMGALRMGLRHGAYCLGCCWALMCVLFVVGVMNLVWVAVLTAFVLVEKIDLALDHAADRLRQPAFEHDERLRQLPVTRVAH